LWFLLPASEIYFKSVQVFIPLYEIKVF